MPGTVKKMTKDSRIYVAGHRGLVGSALVRQLESKGYRNLLLRPRTELDLLNQSAVRAFFLETKPEFVFVAAARVGGIYANSTYPAEFLYENLVIACNIIDAAYQNGTEKLLYLGSSCIYPKLAPQPIHEESLLTSTLEPSNEAYAIAKIAGLKLCEYFQKQYGKRFISAMPTNLYGPGDSFHPENSHVIPGMMRRFHEAKIRNLPAVSVWGSGQPKREFMHVDDLASALLVLMDEYEESTAINVGTGEELTIAELAETMKDVTGYSGKVKFDPTKLDGTPRKVLDISRIRALGWEPRYRLRDGLETAYRWALNQGVFG
jgi:GDP-L-fucose synthase